MEGCPRLHAAAVFRFQRVLEHGDRIRLAVRLLFSNEFQLSVHIAVDLRQAGGMPSKMVFADRGAVDAYTPVLTGEEIVVLGVSLLLATPLVANLLRPWLAVPDHPPWATRSPWSYGCGLALGSIVLCAAATKILTGSYSPFIYFRF